MIALAYLYSVGRQDPNHDAIMRIESEAPRLRLHSSRRRQVHMQRRKATTSDRHWARALPPRDPMDVSLFLLLTSAITHPDGPLPGFWNLHSLLEVE
jgi:hypothetical protein